jgi:GAF domain-containing protein
MESVVSSPAPRYALIAEPDPYRATVYLALLTELGLDAILTRDGAEAQAVLQRRGPPALLVTELALPHVDGFTLLSELRAASASTVALVATAFDELRLMAWPHRERLGIHHFLSRHAPAATLREAFRAALEGRPAQPPEPMAPRLALAPVPPPPVTVRPTVEPAASAHASELAEVVASVAEAFGVPLAVLTLVNGEERRSVAHVTLPRASGSAEARDWTAFHEAAQAPEGMVVPNAAKHPLLREEPLVREGLIGSYAGAPLVTPAGLRLGTLCILDPRRRALGAEELGVLVGVARRIAGELETKARTRATELEAARLRGALEARQQPATDNLDAVRAVLHAVDAGVLLVNAQGQGLVANARLAELLGVDQRELEGLGLDAVRRHLIGLATDPQALQRRLEPSSGPSVTLAVTLELQRPRPRVVRWVARPVPIPGGMGQLSTFTEVTPEVSPARPPRSAVAAEG